MRTSGVALLFVVILSAVFGTVFRVENKPPEPMPTSSRNHSPGFTYLPPTQPMIVLPDFREVKRPPSFYDASAAYAGGLDDGDEQPGRAACGNTARSEMRRNLEEEYLRRLAVERARRGN